MRRIPLKHLLNEPGWGGSSFLGSLGRYCGCCHGCCDFRVRPQKEFHGLEFQVRHSKNRNARDTLGHSDEKTENFRESDCSTIRPRGPGVNVGSGTDTIESADIGLLWPEIDRIPSCSCSVRCVGRCSCS
jgi:hypothetical protein